MIHWHHGINFPPQVIGSDVTEVEAAMVAELKRAFIRQAMSEIGKRKSARKTLAARENGKKGGRPRKGQSQC